MKATEAKFLDFLKKSPQFVIPIYQRTYSWAERECKQLWDDIVRTGKNDDIFAHFVGSIVYIEKGLYHVTGHSPLLVIDGQQRLTTVMLILEALARRLGDTEPIDGFSAKKLRNYYLLNPLEEDDRGFKLLLTQTDKKSLLALVQQKPFPAEYSHRIKENYEYFDKIVNTAGADLVTICKGLAKLVIVDISLDRDQDNPQLIFESMNSTGRELSQSDLIRNYILMGLEPQKQTTLYMDHWRPMEIAFGQKAYGAHFDSFMRHYLTFRTGDIPRTSEVYEAFKLYSSDPNVSAEGVDTLVADIHTLAKYYCAMALGKEKHPELAKAFRDLRELKVDVAYPLLLELYMDYKAEILSMDDLLEAVRLIEAYVFRRAVCAIPTNSLNKTFANFRRALKKDRYIESIKAHFLLLPSYRRFPTDSEFKREILIRDMYNFKNRSYWLRRMENYDRKEFVPVDEYTIEHIMPQNENLSKHWQSALGEDWEEIQKQYLHTLGNLTLTGYNAEYGDKPFTTKRDMDGGFKNSPIRLNVGLGELETWNAKAITTRAEKLSALACSVWTGVSLPVETLATYKKVATKPATYTIEDHPQIASPGPMQELFKLLRQNVLALDPCVSEEILKLYVAYKAETNFVDVVPQLKRLRLSLNMHFHELRDPKGVAHDVTNLGRWGNGDVEVPLNSVDELPYVMGLIRQSFEKQIGNGEGVEG